MTRASSPFQLQLFPGSEGPADTARPTSRLEPPRPPARKPPPPARPERAREEVARKLRALMPGRLGSLTLTDNRSTIVSARETAGGRRPGGRRPDGRLDVRIHRCFATAPDETLAAVATFLTSAKRSHARRDALAVIRAYFERHRPAATRDRRRHVVLRPVGRVLDLRDLRDELNRRYFDDQLEVHVTWGRRPSRRRRRHSFSVRLGTFGHHDNVVRIHRCLDRPDVPRYVVESIVYHEMLHAALPPVTRNGRRRIHTPEFRRRERLFPHYRRAERWLDRNLKRLV